MDSIPLAVFTARAIFFMELRSIDFGCARHSRSKLRSALTGTKCLGFTSRSAMSWLMDCR